MHSDWDVEIVDEQHNGPVEIDLTNSSDHEVVFVSEERASQQFQNLSLGSKPNSIKGEYTEMLDIKPALTSSTNEDVDMSDANSANANPNGPDTNSGDHNAIYRDLDDNDTPTTTALSQFSGQGTADDPVTILEEVDRKRRPEDTEFDMRVECIIPGKEVSKSLKWSTNRVFYWLEKDFGRNCVISFRGKQIQKFMCPFRCSKDLKVSPTKVQVKISTERQLRDEQLRMQREADGMSDSDADTTDGESTSDLDDARKKFPITLQGRHGSVRVLVSQETKIEELVRHYMQSKQIDSLHFSARFDGDLVDMGETILNLGIEEDDNLDIYT